MVLKARPMWATTMRKGLKFILVIGLSGANAAFERRIVLTWREGGQWYGLVKRAWHKWLEQDLGSKNPGSILKGPH